MCAPPLRPVGLGVRDQWDPCRNTCKVHFAAVSHPLTLPGAGVVARVRAGAPSGVQEWGRRTGPTHKRDVGSLPALGPPPTDIRRRPPEGQPGQSEPCASRGLCTRHLAVREAALEDTSVLLFWPILSFPGARWRSRPNGEAKPGWGPLSIPARGSLIWGPEAC